jgi:hypothetical protein
VNTLCHELAHLKHFNHGPNFQAFYAKILSWARQEGIYRPGALPRPSRALEQPTLTFRRVPDRSSTRPAHVAETPAERRTARGPNRPAGEPAPPAPVTRPVQLDLFA